MRLGLATTLNPRHLVTMLDPSCLSMATIPDPYVWAGDNARPKALGSDNHVRPKRLGIATILNPGAWALQPFQTRVPGSGKAM